MVQFGAQGADMPKVIDEAGLFRTVLDMLVQRGYDGATTHEIAAAAGVNEATLFRRYKSKAGLFEKAINHQLAFTPLNRLAYTGDLKADLLSIVQAYMETYQLFGPIIPALLVEIPRHPELVEALSKPLANIQNIASIIQRYQERGLLKPAPPLSMVNVLIGPLLIHQLTHHASIPLPPLALELDEYVEAFLNGRAVPA